jgi:hypothetical protein
MSHLVASLRIDEYCLYWTHPDLGRPVGICVGRYHEEKTSFDYSEPLHNFTNLERVAIREKAHSIGSAAANLHKFGYQRRQPAAIIQMLIGQQ